MFRRLIFLQHQNALSFSMSSSLMNLGASMKKLIDGKKYQEALNLFNEHSTPGSNIATTLALKACAKLKNLERGITIHQHLSSQSIKNSFINTSLIHLYSE